MQVLQRFREVPKVSRGGAGCRVQGAGCRVQVQVQRCRGGGRAEQVAGAEQVQSEQVQSAAEQVQW